MERSSLVRATWYSSAYLLYLVVIWKPLESSAAIRL